MARINIEDSLAHDERMKAVIRKIGEALAFGEWYRIARCAQRYWTDEKNPIPQSVWEISEFNNIFIQVGIVKKTEGGLYLSGSEEFFSWIISKKENGRKGGVKSGEKRKINDIIEANASGGEANASETKPPTLTPILTPTQIHNTALTDCTKKTNSDKQSELLKKFEEVWSLYPIKKGKDSAIRSFKKSVKNQDDFNALKIAIQNYSKECVEKQTEKRFIKHGSTFFNCWREYLEKDISPLEVEKNNILAKLESL